MTGFRDSGAQHRALFPGAWRAYDGIVAAFGLLLMVINALIGVDAFPANVDRWISVGIAGVTAVLIWMRLRAGQLGVVTVDNGHLTDDAAPNVEPPPKAPEDDSRC